MMETRPVSAAFDAAASLALAVGVRDIGSMPEPWQHKVDERWSIAINGHKEPMRSEPEGCMGVEIPGFHMAVWWCGWLAGFLSPFGGVIAAGTEANEDTFIAAVQAATRQAGQEKLPW